MKKVLLMAVLGFSTLMFSGCAKDPCKDVTCQNSGVPTENGEECDCDCTAGYEGELCEILMNAKFVGSYNVTDGCTTSGYSQTVSAGGAAGEISFSNLGNFNNAAVVKATVDGRSFTIANHTDAAGRKFNGSGSLSSDNKVLSGSYTVTYTDGTSETCTITMNK